MSYPAVADDESCVSPYDRGGQAFHRGEQRDAPEGLEDDAAIDAWYEGYDSAEDDVCGQQSLAEAEAEERRWMDRQRMP
ncbi:hypothetical protein UFOVP1040_27 [uncultured Caudovirales phage]|uniref:Uncharacterized protein n=1 Tax=uncultured Caudovirales phage TaxID=2100421 RepID=A0A6J5Q6Y7_9CAUD|nr:hypothetical protein UFOVP1040_27 [uncultured Caudovirales phage]